MMSMPYKPFELNAIDYILKPFDEERIHKTLEKIIQIGKIGTEKTTFSPFYEKR